jgi:hypothetical protein
MNIKELAKQAGFDVEDKVGEIWFDEGWHTSIVERFAELVAAAEREACAKLFQPTYPRPCDCVVCDCGNKADAQYIAEWDVHATIAKSIRARGDKHD